MPRHPYFAALVYYLFHESHFYFTPSHDQAARYTQLAPDSIPLLSLHRHHPAISALLSTIIYQSSTIDARLSTLYHQRSFTKALPSTLVYQRSIVHALLSTLLSTLCWSKSPLIIMSTFQASLFTLAKLADTTHLIIGEVHLALAKLADEADLIIQMNYLDTWVSMILAQIMRIPYVKAAFWVLAIIQVALESIMGPTLSKIMIYGTALYMLISTLHLLFLTMMAAILLFLDIPVIIFNYFR